MPKHSSKQRRTRELVRGGARPATLVWIALLCACNGDTTGATASGDGTSGEASTATSSTSGSQATTDSTSSGAADGTTAADTTGGDPIWPPPFVPTTSVEVTVDPAVTLGEGPCRFECTPAVREELPPVMDLCELLGGDGLASGDCSGDTCLVPEEVCMTDEFVFGGSYCALGGYPRAYCGAYVQDEPAFMSVSTRILHRLVGAQLIMTFTAAMPVPAVQIYLQEGWDEVDEQGLPYPIPSRVAPLGGSLVISSMDLDPGGAFAGTYELEFAWPDDPSVTRTISGHFSHTIQ